jgi:hypothetical protein
MKQGVYSQYPGQDLNYGRYLAVTNDVYDFSLISVVLLLIMTAVTFSHYHMSESDDMVHNL